MKVIEIVPRAKAKLYDGLVKKEADIRRGGRGTFYRAGRAGRNAAQWKHRRYGGSVNLSRGESEAVTAKIRGQAGGDWQMLLAFLGFVDRHFGDKVAKMMIDYR
jgi:hypothetical protein